MKKEKRGRELFYRFEPAMNALAAAFSHVPYPIRRRMLDWFRMKNGYLGLGIRFALLKSMAKACGKNVAIHPGVFFFDVKNLEVGSNVTFHPMCYVDAGGGVAIGNDVSIAHGVSILSATHSYQRRDVPIADQGLIWKETKIENNVWVGAKATILAGVTVHEGAVVGANTLVNRDLVPNEVAGGVPARFLKTRGGKDVKENFKDQFDKTTGGGGM